MESGLDLKKLMGRAEQMDLGHSRIRSVYWKMYLGYVSLEVKRWKTELETKRKAYEQLWNKYKDLGREKDDKDKDKDEDKNKNKNRNRNKNKNKDKDKELRERIELD
ncbi:hypothetical protein RFI_24585, partial [Reticulomyxa filosa]